jgi:hypothetical protein
VSTLEDLGERVEERVGSFAVRAHDFFQEDERVLVVFRHIGHLREDVVDSTDVVALLREQGLDLFQAVELGLLRQQRAHLRRHRVADRSEPISHKVRHLGPVEALVSRNVERAPRLPALRIAIYTRRVKSRR